MNQQQYKLGWQIACWSTLAIPVLSMLNFVTVVFGIIGALAIGGVAFGFYTASNELVKDGHPAAIDMKSASTTLFIVTALNIIGTILGATADVDSVSSGLAILIFAGLLIIACAIFMIMFRGKICSAINHLGINNALFGTGILVYAIGQIIAGFGWFLLGISPSKATLGAFVVFTILGGITVLVGAILWIIGMFQITEKVTK